MLFCIQLLFRYFILYGLPVLVWVLIVRSGGGVNVEERACHFIGTLRFYWQSEVYI